MKLIDSSVHVAFASDAEFRSYLPEPMKTRGFPGTERPWYQAPGGEYLEHTYGEGFPWAGGYPGSNPDAVAADVLHEDVELAILQPLGRGNLPDWLLNNGLYSATNQWLAERFLDGSAGGGRFRGTILVNPEDPDGAIAEIRRWADHPKMVQIGVPLQSREPYGKPQFQPIWREAAEHGLPISLHISGGSGIEFPPTPAGHARTYPHYVSYMPWNYFHHLSSLILDGTLVRIPDVKFVFADGGMDLLTPLIWRLDTFWRAMREQTPWVVEAPSEYMRDHVRFCFSPFEGPAEPTYTADWMGMMGKDDLVMYASNYPFWSTATPDDLPPGLLGKQQQKILHDNAASYYGLDARVSA